MPDVESDEHAAVKIVLSDTADTVVIEPDDDPNNPGGVIVRINGEEKGYTASEVHAGIDIWCGGGDDVVRVDPSLEVPLRIWGQSGNDWLSGGAGADSLYGGDGDDELFGSGGDDEAYGNAGADVLTMGMGADYAHGGAGDDTIRLGRGDDAGFGGAGCDKIFGGAGSDVLASASPQPQPRLSLSLSLASASHLASPLRALAGSRLRHRLQHAPGHLGASRRGLHTP